jgi:hypothetical protein
LKVESEPFDRRRGSRVTPPPSSALPSCLTSTTRAAAQREAWARWAKIEPEITDTLALVADAGDNFNAQDRERLRAILADDLVVEDRRRTRMGRIEGGDAYTDSLARFEEPSPERTR